jgi:hypothetical protein
LRVFLDLNLDLELRRQARIMMSNILNCWLARTEWGRLAGMMIICPALTA